MAGPSSGGFGLASISDDGTFQYTPSDEIVALAKVERSLEHDNLKLDASIRKAQLELRTTRQQFETLKKAVQLAECRSELDGVEYVDDMRKMVELEKKVAEAGGVAGVRKMINEMEAYEKSKEEAVKVSLKATSNSTARADVNKRYRQMLRSHGLETNSVYRVKWTSLVCLRSREALSHAYSFAIVLAGCELPQKNELADPKKIRLRLTCVVGDSVHELYIPWSDEADFMTRVTASNVNEMCQSVFCDANMTVLHAADGGGIFWAYKEKLMHDSLFAIKSYVRNSFGFVNSMKSSTTKRSRTGVNYDERRANKRSRSQPTAEIDEEVEHGDDDEDSVVSSLASRAIRG